MGWKPDYVTSTELKDYVRVGDTDDDVEVALAITTASRAVDRACKRQFGKVAAAVARYYTAYVDPVLGRCVVDIDDLQTETDLAIAVDTDGDETYADALTEYSLRPINAVADGMPWTKLAVGINSTVGMPAGVDQVRVTAIFGWTDVPSAVKQATLLQASRLLSRRNSPYGIAGSPENGSELRLLAKLDPDVEVSLAEYKRTGPREWFA